LDDLIRFRDAIYSRNFANIPHNLPVNKLLLVSDFAAKQVKHLKLLLAEDDTLLGDGIKLGLNQQGYAVDWFTDGQSTWQALQTENFDIIILDLGLPRLSGLEILERTRTAGLKTPILILTARDSIQDRVHGLDSGADDYVTKPFDLTELSARLRALQRRSTNRGAPKIIHGDIELDPAKHIITYQGEEVTLSRREYALLQKLLENAGNILSREHITQSLYGWEEEVDSNALEVHIHNLRKKFGTKTIRTIRGIGYMVPNLDNDESP
jgi:two-component system response regulator QseB